MYTKSIMDFNNIFYIKMLPVIRYFLGRNLNKLNIKYQSYLIQQKSTNSNKKMHTI